MSEEMKKISIVMPVYNAERYLQDCISDLLGQTYPHFELICVDDGSEDSSLHILKEFQCSDERIIVKEQINTGAGSARNVGLRYANGEYILFLDADDRFSNRLLEEALFSAERFGTDILMFDSACFDFVSGKELSSDWIIDRKKIPLKEYFNFKDIPERIFNFSHNVAWNKMFRRSFLEKYQIQFQNVPHTNDTFFMCAALVKAGKISFLDKKLIYYRQNSENSLTGKGIRQRYPLCVCDVLTALKNYLESEHLYKEVWKSFANLAAEQLMWNLEMLSNYSFSTLFTKLKEEALSEYDIVKLSENEFIRSDLYLKINYLQAHGESEYLFYLLEEKRTIISKINMDFTKLLKDFEGLLKYSDELSFRCNVMKAEKRWFFDNTKVRKGSAVILYGAGEKGTDYYEQFEKTKECKVVAWVDKNYQGIKGKKVKIQSPEIIKELKFSYIIVAVSENNMKQEIKETLKSMGVSSKKVIS